MNIETHAIQEAVIPPIIPSATTLLVFDENLIPNSPAGSCLLKVVETVAGEIPLHLFFNRLELKDALHLRKTRVPLPAGPMVLRAVLFTLFSGLAYLFRERGKNVFRLSTQGCFPFCDLSYAHFCHFRFMRRHLGSLSGGFLRRGARFLAHTWGYLTERIAFQSARIVVVPSQGLAREIRASYPGIAHKVQVIANPVDTELYAPPPDFRKDSARVELGLDPADLVLCFCALGNFEHKGLRLILKTMSQNAKGGTKLLVVGGSVGEIREFEKLRLRFGLEGQVRFVGFQRNIRPFLWVSDAFVFPSLKEVFPLVCLQAAAAGLPLITTQLYGVEEFMVDGSTGWIVNRDSASIGDAIQRAGSDRSFLRQMGRQALERVQMYSEDQFRLHWRSLLDRELKNS